MPTPFVYHQDNHNVGPSNDRPTIMQKLVLYMMYLKYIKYKDILDTFLCISIHHYIMGWTQLHIIRS